MKINSRSVVLSLLWVLFYTVNANSGSIEIVQSVPVETALDVRGIRHTQEVWLDMISSAKKTIDLEHFYINHVANQSLEPVITALKSAAKRGVKVRFVLDSKFFANYPDVPTALGKIENFQVKTVDFSRYGGVQHAKFMVVDQADSFLGSANFDWLAISHIHEVGVRIKDIKIARELTQIFNKDFGEGMIKANEPSSDKALMEAKLVASPAKANPVGIGLSVEHIVQLMSSAKTSLKIQVYQYTVKDPYTSGKWDMLDKTIRAAADRGVKVKLLVDQVSLKSGGADLKSLAANKNIEVRSVTIPQWSGGALKYARLVHSKYLVVDQEGAWIGTENWSQGYFTGSRNVGVILHSKTYGAQVDQIFEQVWNSPYSKPVK